MCRGHVRVGVARRAIASRGTPRARCGRSARRRRSPVRPDRRVDDADPLAAEHLVEAGAELAVAVVDEETRSLEEVGEAEVAGLLGDPAAGRFAVQPARWTRRLPTS